MITTPRDKRGVGAGNFSDAHDAAMALTSRDTYYVSARRAAEAPAGPYWPRRQLAGGARPPPLWPSSFLSPLARYFDTTDAHRKRPFRLLMAYRLHDLDAAKIDIVNLYIVIELYRIPLPDGHQLHAPLFTSLHCQSRAGISYKIMPPEKHQLQVCAFRYTH